ncbi:MAG: daunorubicin ABC transporter ATP-binding protein, partial [Acidimicrobiia bacterium]|nr:daunorubicin ABC transporter ATP-binding protein [Acidimicrobiia bacterium]
RLEGAKGTVAAVAAAANGEGFALRSLSVGESSLETVFIELTGKDLRE